MATGARIWFEVNDETAKEDAVYSATSAKPWSDYESLKDDRGYIDGDPSNPLLRVYTTGEKDAFRLGGARLFPNQPEEQELGWCSAVLSGADGSFSSVPVLSCHFDEEHASVGVTLFFDVSTHLTDFMVFWLDGTGAVITSRTVTGNTERVCFVEAHIYGYQGLKINAIKTDAPYRYAKIRQIDFGQRMVYDGASLVSASVTEEADLSGASAPAGSLRFTVLDPQGRLNPVNPDGIYAYLRRGIPLHVEFLVDNASSPGGLYYLDTWEGSNAGVAGMTAVDILGTEKTYESRFYSGASPADILADIAGKLGAPVYAGSLPVTVLAGYIPACSVQEAVAQVCLSSGGFVRAGRSGGLDIGPPGTSPLTLAEGEVLGEPEVTRTDPPGGFEIEVNDYTVSEDGVSRVINIAPHYGGYPSGTILRGVYPFKENGEPAVYADAVPSNLQNIKSAVGYWDRVEYEYIYNGKTSSFEIPNKVVTVHPTDVVVDGDMESGDGTVSVKGIPLIIKDNYAVVLESLKGFYSRRTRLKFRAVWRPGMDCGACVTVPTRFGPVTGHITRMDIDLTGGLLTTAEVIA